MSARTKIKFGVMPYSDGSGDQFSVEIAVGKEGTEDQVEIEQLGTSITLTAREWLYLKNAVDEGFTAFFGLQSGLSKAPENERE